LSAGTNTVTIAVGAANSYAIPAGLGSAATVNLQFAPTYSGQPPAGYQLQVQFNTPTAPQICYQATAQCGPVANTATLTLAGIKPIQAGVDFGSATGPICEPGILKICKVAGT